MKRIYIAHADNHHFCHRLASDLRLMGFQVTIGKLQAQTTHVWEAETFQQLKQSQLVLALISDATLQDAWMQRQLNTAREQGKVLVMVQTDTLSDDMPNPMAWLRRYPTHDFTADYQIALRKLFETLTPYRTKRNFDIPAQDRIPNPFVGLNAFQQWDAPVYFGRDNETRRAIQKLRENNFLAIVGNSGVGKSSLARAGILPQIRQGVIPALDGAAIDIVRVQAHDDLSQWLPDTHHTVLLVDELAHAFTQLGERDRSDLFNNLRVWSQRDDITIIVTLRSEFYSALNDYPDFAERFTHDTIVNLPTPTREQFRAVIENPAQIVGLRYEAGLVDCIMDDIAAQTATFPLVQYMLYRLFQHREASILTLEGYRSIGGIHALAHAAETAYETLNEAQRERLRPLLYELIYMDDDNVLTVGDVTLAQDDPIVSAFDAVDVIVAETVQNRSNAAQVRIAHAALLTDWQRIRQWVDDHTDDLHFASTLIHAMQHWQANETDDSYLLHGTALTQAEAWIQRHDYSQTRIGRYVQQSRKSEATRQARAHRRRVWQRRRRYVVQGIRTLALLVIVIGFGFTVFWLMRFVL